MGIFTRNAMDALMKTTHPEINRRQCWNLHPHRKPLHRPARISAPMANRSLPARTLSRTGIPPTAGLWFRPAAAAASPFAGAGAAGHLPRRYNDNDTIWIGCEKCTRKNSMVRTCISALTWEALAYLALNKKIVLDLTPLR